MKSFFEQVVFDVGSSISTELVEDPAIGRMFHFHPEIELTYLERGSGWRFVGDRIGEFQDGDLTLLGSMLPHLFVSHDQFGSEPVNVRRQSGCPRIQVIKFARNFGLSAELKLPEFAAVARLLTDASSGVLFPEETARNARKKIRKIFETNGMTRLTTLFDLLDELAQSEYGKLDVSRGGETETDTRILRVLRFIGTRLEKGRAPSLSEAAAFACLSPASFSRYFRRKTRKSFMEYLSELKIGKAMCLLRKPDLSICEISYRCGFENLSNFNRQFQKMNHMTPREFRKLINVAFDC